MKRLITLLMIGVGLSLHAELEVADVQVFSGRPWREVAIGYTITGTTKEPRCIQVKATDSTTGTAYNCRTLIGAGVEPGHHVMKWNAQADGVKTCVSNAVITVQVVEPLYCIIDLSGGVDAENYPVVAMADVPFGGWTDEYKTSKLVLRRIEAGVFTMGSPSDEYGHWNDEVQHVVTLTKPFYIGVIEVTQRQWELVMGTRPSYFNNESCYAMRPVERVSYDMIRGNLLGGGWPTNDAVDATSFLGVLRTKTGLAFDLPTEAQWEYACRAGTTTSLNNGKDLRGDSDVNLAEVGRYARNSGYSAYTIQSCTDIYATAKVGSYVPNAWGLYDMHGNVQEWCLDWWETLPSSATSDPKGPSTGLRRVIRGGGYSWGTSDCRSSSRRSPGLPSDISTSCGFRIATPMAY